jgi:branched-chain amino acid transport system ATP-binding protein
MALLDVQNITMRFGGLVAVKEFSLAIQPGELVGLIGPNGAGKTTAFNMITGVYKPTEGVIRFDGKMISGLKPYHITKRGIARTFQNIRLFSALSVLENVLIGAFLRHRTWLASAILRTQSVLKEDAELWEQAIHWLETFDLADVAHSRSCDLPYGKQRRLEIARALATQPKLLLLDEPAAGMNPQESEELMHLIRRLRDEFGQTILLIEHDMKVVMGICERVFVLDYGQLIAEGIPEVIRKDPRVVEAYLGEPM